MTDLLTNLKKIKKSNRRKRISQEIQREVAYIFLRYLKDFLPEMITVTKVVMSKDFSLANIFITVLDPQTFFSAKDIKDISAKDILSIIKKKTSFTRKCLAKSVKLRNIPQIIFTLDEGIIDEMRLINLISQLK